MLTSRVLLVITPALANLVAVALRHGSYETRQSTDADEVGDTVRDWAPHLAVVDIDHHQDFLDLIRAAAPADMPVLAFTRKRETGVKIRAFERGADDIIEVPFTLDEIVARPYALIRRSRGTRPTLVPKIGIADLEVDLLAQTVRMNGGTPLELTPLQQTLLYVLAANAGEVITRETLLGSIWGADFRIESNVVDRHIRELRVKLGDDWKTPRYIETVPGRGYRFRKNAPTVA